MTCPTLNDVIATPHTVRWLMWDEPRKCTCRLDCVSESVPCCVRQRPLKCPRLAHILATPFETRWTEWDAGKSDCQCRTSIYGNSCGKYYPCCVKSLSQKAVHVLQTTCRSDAYAKPSTTQYPRILIFWPTIPVPTLKGADTRPIEFARAAARIGTGRVEMLTFSTVSHDIGMSYTNENADIQKLLRAGVSCVHSYMKGASSREIEKLIVDRQITTIITWLWANSEFLRAARLLATTAHAMRRTVIAACDDVGVSLRALTTVSSKGNVSLAEATLLSNTNRLPTQVQSLWTHESVILSMADIVVGISKLTLQSLTRMAPSAIPMLLRYYYHTPEDHLSVQTAPAASSNMLLFVGYANHANAQGLTWFAESVLPHVHGDVTLHIVGSVCRLLHRLCSNTSTALNIRCHGVLDDASISNMMSRSRAMINPILEPAGVATKSCLALANGLPVVTTSLDGTFPDGQTTPRGVFICPPESACMARAVQDTIEYENSADDVRARIMYVDTHFGVAAFESDVNAIIKSRNDVTLNVLIEGDAIKYGESLASQNWNMLNQLSRRKHLKVFQIGTLSPSIQNVYIHGAAQRIDVWLSQKWPPRTERPHECPRASCSAAVLLPWEFGSLPQMWMPGLNTFTQLWAPSKSNANAFAQSGYPEERIQLLPCGIDCADGRMFAAERPESSRRDSFLFIGGLLPRKGVDVMIAAWHAEGLCDHESARLVLHTSYTNGFTVRQLHDMKEKIHTCNSIAWSSGRLTEEKISALFAQADVYLGVARAEGFGIPIVEALARGILPVVVTSQAGTNETIAAGDTFRDHVVTIPSPRETCTIPPCSENGSEICVLPPCRERAPGTFSCDCTKLVKPAWWLQPDVIALQTILRQRDRLPDVTADARAFALSHCWSHKRGERLEMQLRMLHADRVPQQSARPIVVSLTTNALRIRNILPVIQSLCTQSLPAERVYLSLPVVHARLGDAHPFQVPSFLDEFSECVHVHTMHDSGPSLKLLGAIAHGESTDDTLIVTVDDDKVYDIDFLKGIYELHLRHPTSAVGFAGSSTSRTRFCMTQKCRSDVEVAQVEGFAGMLYPRRALGSAAMMSELLHSVPQVCIPDDDIIISVWLALRGVRIWRGFTDKPMHSSLSEDSTALHSMNTNNVHVAWHPSEMAKYVPCLRTAFANVTHVRAERIASQQQRGHADKYECHTWCYTFVPGCVVGSPECMSSAEYDTESGLWRNPNEWSYRDQQIQPPSGYTSL